MNWVFASQAFEVIMPAVFAEEVRIQRVDVLKGELVGLGDVAPRFRLFHLRGSEPLPRSCTHVRAGPPRACDRPPRLRPLHGRYLAAGKQGERRDWTLDCEAGC